MAVNALLLGLQAPEPDLPVIESCFICAGPLVMIAYDANCSPSVIVAVMAANEIGLLSTLPLTSSHGRVFVFSGL